MTSTDSSTAVKNDNPCPYTGFRWCPDCNASGVGADEWSCVTCCGNTVIPAKT